MNYQKDKVSDLKIAYIGGGSKGWAWGLMSDLAAEASLSGTVALYDIDFDAAKTNEIIGNTLKNREDVKGEWCYICVETLSEALVNADFVVISILPGTFEEMESDVHTPEIYGIYQSVGDTVGPGGLMRALRTIPMYVEIAEAIKTYCPKAWVINYTNPMTLCVKTLYHVFPEIKAVGCCHEVFGTQNLLSAALKDVEGIEGVSREDIKVNVLGINHFTWIDRATWQGVDLFPIYKKFVEKYYARGFILDESQHWMNNMFACAHSVKFDLFQRYGLIAAAGDRHLAEFCPGAWYLKNPETVYQWMFGLTSVSWRKEDLKKREERSERLKTGIEVFHIHETGEEGVRMMKALLGLGDLITNVNLPNSGQMLGVPKGSVVETNAIFQKDNVIPLLAGELPVQVNALVNRHIYNQQSILKAVMDKDRNIAFAAFINDPLVTCDLAAAVDLFDRMTANTKEYLCEWMTSK